MKLRTKMILLCVCVCLIPMLGVSAYTLTLAQREMKSTIQSAVDSYGSQLSLSLDAMITANDQLSKSFLLDTDLLSLLREQNLSQSGKISRDARIRQQLMRVSIVNQSMEDALLITLEGDVVCYSRTDNPISASRLRTEEWLEELMASERTLSFSPVHDQPYFERLPDKQVITVSRRLYDISGFPCGFLMFEYPPEYIFPFNSAFSEMQEAYGLSCSVYNAEGKRMYGEVAALPEDIRPGIDYHHLNEQSGLSIEIAAPYASVFRRMLYLRRLNTVIFVMDVLLSLGLVLWITRRLTSRFHTLERAMQTSGEGKYVTVDAVKGRDEIAHVTRIYNEMIVREEGLVRQVYQSEIEQEKAKLTALRAQINPHMLFNTLESIRMVALVGGDEKVSDMIQTLSEMFRLSLEEGTLHTVRDEVAYTRAFLELQNIRFDDRFTLSVEMPEAAMEAGMIALVFQPVVENSISHGLRDPRAKMHIRLEAEVHGEMMEIRISDDGRGMSPAQLEKLSGYIEGRTAERPARDSVQSHGIGLINIHERLQLHYGPEYGIRIESEEGRGTMVCIRIPYQSRENPEDEALEADRIYHGGEAAE